MKKQDLKDGMILETRNGERYLLTNGAIRNFGDFTALTNYNEDLKNKYDKQYDIVKVYINNEIYSLSSIFQGVTLSLLWERKELKLTEKEIEILNALKTLGYKNIARDKSGHYYAHYKEPEKLDDSWYSNYHWTPIYEYKKLFKFIKWEDDEPKKIDDLLKGV